MAHTDRARPAGEAPPSATEKPSSSSARSAPVNNFHPHSSRRIDIRFLAIYPLTLFIGLLYAHISPTAKPSYGTTGTASSNASADQPAPINYFAYKRNIVNIGFVKIGWIWTTLAFLGTILIQLQRSSPSSAIAVRNRRVIHAVNRFALATLSWIFTTQWAFGPPLSDRGFIATGGKCMQSDPTPSGPREMTPHGITSIGIFSSSTCKLSGGTWKGGHDVSGHVFMLSLTSALLFIEWYGGSSSATAAPTDTDTNSVREKGASSDDQSSAVKEKSPSVSRTEETSFYRWTRNYVFLVIGLSWWMLLMTTIFFHTWTEKVRIWGTATFTDPE